jgi:hypothetical protein
MQHGDHLDATKAWPDPVEQQISRATKHHAPRVTAAQEGSAPREHGDAPQCSIDLIIK